jgi:hypothetical protein
MDRFEKLAKEEKRWLFARDSGPLLAGVFPRPIYCLLWWWPVTVAFALSYASDIRSKQSLPIKYYLPPLIAIMLTVWILGIVARKEERKKWFTKREALQAPLAIKAALYLIPVLCVLAVFSIAR